MADFKRSLKLISCAKQGGLKTKSGLMLGLGEKKEEVISVMAGLLDSGCDILTLGQYLAPSRSHFPVQEIIKEEVFEEYRNKALDMGFPQCASGPYVRSSYMADLI
jgi:lipoic acid synthetase